MPLRHLSDLLKDPKKEFRHDFNLYLTGHSLGGGLASLLSAKKAGLPTVTFNAPGMQRSFIGSHLLDIIGRINLHYVDTSQMLHLRSTGDPVSSLTGKHMGKVEEVYVDAWGDGDVLGSSRHLAQHSIQNMVDSLKSKPWFHKDLGFKANYI
jgi:putative lipase involved disintegration of autophagic bodies